LLLSLYPAIPATITGAARLAGAWLLLQRRLLMPLCRVAGPGWL